jgi:hypothetical protein
VVRLVVVFTFLAALAVFCVVQERITAGGAHDYAEQARAAIASHVRPASVDEVMRPRIHRSVRVGLSSAAGVLVLGLGAALILARSPRG